MDTHIVQTSRRDHSATPSGKKSYSELTQAEKWQWHADHYAWRVVYLDAPFDEPRTPADPEGVWFDKQLAHAAVAKFREKRDGARLRRFAQHSSKLEAEGRAICDRWAQSKGFRDWDEADASGCRHSDVIAAVSEDARKMPGPQAARYTASSLGAKATPQPIAPGEVDHLMKTLKRRES